MAYIKELKPDITTLDISMPEQNGIKTLEQIMEFDSNAIVIMISAVGQQQMIVNALQIGAKNFIRKPFVDADVVQRINKCVS